MIVSFDELVLKCLDDEAKAHIREAVRCYEGSAYRAAIVSAHVAVCFDLIAKLKSLAADGDAAAKALITRLETLQEQKRKSDPNAVKGLLEFERNLLEEFRDNFEFFGTEEYADLFRLRDDRNRCAHPTFLNDSLPYSPPAELARLHIRNAITHVLSQAPRQGKAALNSLRATVLSPYFPDKLEGAVERLRGSELGNARDSLVKAFIDDVAFGYPDKSHPLTGSMNGVLAARAAVEIHRAVALPRIVTATDKLAKSGDLAAVRLAAYFIIYNADIAAAVGNGTKAALKTWLKKETANTKGSTVKKALGISWWRESALEAVKTLTAEQLGGIADAPKEIVSRAAEVYATAKNWTEANDLAANCIIPFADRFAITDIEHIFSKARDGADLIGSHSFRDFINSLYDKNPIPNSDLESLLAKYDLEYYAKAEVEQDDDDIPF